MPWAAVLASVAAALASWLALLNRLINYGTHGRLKLISIALSPVLALLAGVLWPLLVGPPLSYAAPLLLLALLGAGEIHRILVRRQAQARALCGTRALPEPAVSTTALVVCRATVVTPGVGRLRVAHLSDLHVGPYVPFEYFTSTLARLMAEEPDLILITGDFISHPRDLPLLRQLLVGTLHARHGVYAVFGNHDWSDPDGVKAVLEEAGIRRVTGASIMVELGPERRLVIEGTEEPWGPKFVRDQPLGHIPTLTLSHTPDNVYRLARRGVSAVFSGHTHGGQFCIPRLGGLVVPSKYGRRFDRGHFRVGKTHLFVSAGLGIDSIPLRLFCPPDFLVVDFVESVGTGDALPG